MTDIEWGAEIAVNGVRPAWLRDEDKLRWYGRNTRESFWEEFGHTNAKDLHWDNTIVRIRLPADHPYYLATSRGFTYWPGGKSAPGKDSNYEVIIRSGNEHIWDASVRWSHEGSNGDIIGYRKRTEQPAPAIAQLTEADLEEAREAYFNSSEGDSAKFYATRWGLLAPDPDLTLAKSIVGDAGAIALAIKAARENGR